jgi:phosphocarrier protein
MSTATRTITISDPVGIHARPASQLSQAAVRSGCNVILSKNSETSGVNASSILSIMSLGIKQGDTVTISVEGENAETVADELAATIIKGE